MGPAGPPNDAGPGLDSRVRFPMIYPGIYHLHIGSNNNGTGTYRITVNKTGQVDDIPANPRTSASLKLGAPGRSHYLGNGGANDRDWYRTNLTRGTTYRFDVGGDHLFEDEYRLLVPHIVGIYDSDSNLAEHTSITPTDPTPVVSVDFTPPATGRYYVSVGTTAGHKGMYHIILSDSRHPVTFPARHRSSATAGPANRNREQPSHGQTGHQRQNRGERHSHGLHQSDHRPRRHHQHRIFLPVVPATTEPLSCRSPAPRLQPTPFKKPT